MKKEHEPSYRQSLPENIKSTDDLARFELYRQSLFAALDRVCLEALEDVVRQGKEQKKGRVIKS